MPGIPAQPDPDGLLEYSVVFSDRSLNHMSQAFQEVMNDISAALKSVYNAKAVVVVPGGGTYGMEAVARQLATDRKCLVIRNGYFSYRWSQILDMGDIASSVSVIRARPRGDGPQAPFEPPPLEEVIAAIEADKPAVVFAPHVETSAGMLLPDDYVRAVGSAVRSAGGLFVLDCIASGALWVDMEASSVDVLLSAPQKGWSSSPCAALVMLNQRALERCEQTQSTSFACDLRKWLDIMRAYENGAHGYHATMPTDALRQFRDTMMETREFGLEKAKHAQVDLGREVRGLLEDRGFASVAAEGFEAPGVVVCYTNDAEIHNGTKFREQGIQIAAGVPLMCDEPEGFMTFRVGLFGLDKLEHVGRTVRRLEVALDRIADA